MVALNENDALWQALADAGCDAALSKRFVELAAHGCEQEGLALLAQHRASLLTRCHAEEKKIDCLDYLIYQIKKQAKT